MALDDALWVGGDETDLTFIARGPPRTAERTRSPGTMRSGAPSAVRTYTYVDDPDDEDDNRLIVFVRTNSTPWEAAPS